MDEFNVRIERKAGDEWEVTDDPVVLLQVGGTLHARADATAIAAQVAAVPGAGAALVETFITEREKAYSRVLRAELAKLTDESPGLKAYFQPQPFEIVTSQAHRDERTGRLVATTTHKYKVG